MFWLLIVIGLVVWLVFRNKDTSTSSLNDTDIKLEQRNFEWAQFIAGYKNKVKSKVEKALVDRMLSDIAKQGLPIPGDTTTNSSAYKSNYVYATAAQQATQASTAAAVSTTYDGDEAHYIPGPMLVQQPSTPVDSAILLLYFGAFLFLGAVGLFLAFGNLPGVAKSSLVGMLVVLFYGSGQWLFQNSKRLKQGGLAFIGIGLVLLPFFGLSLHSDTFNRENGALIWGITSLLAVALYYHALVTTRQAFITYSMLAAVLSLFESGVSIVSLPTYYFALGMAAVSILFLVFSRLKKDMKDLEEPLVISANALIPISLFMSLLYMPTYGFFQVSLSLLLASAFYAVYAWISSGDKRSHMAVLADCFLLLGIGLLVYSQSTSIEVLTPTFCLLAASQLMVLAFIRRSRGLSAKLFRWLMLITASLPLVACLASVNNAALLAATLFASAAFMVSIHTLTRDPGYITTAACLLFIWVAEMGFYWQKSSWSAEDFIIAWLGLAVLLFGQRLRHLAVSPLGIIYRVSYVTALALVVLSGMFTTWQVALAVMLSISLICYLLSKYEPQSQSFMVCMLVLHYFSIIAGSFGINSTIRADIISLMFAGLGVLHYVLGTFVHKSKQEDLYFGSALIGTLIGAFCVVLDPVHSWPMLISLSLFAAVSLLEHRRMSSSNMLVVSLVAQYVAVAWGASLLSYDLQPLTTPFMFMLLALAQYLVGRLSKEEYRQIWSYTSMIGLMIGAASVVSYGRTTAPMITNIVLLISISFAEARRLKSQVLIALSITMQYILVLWLCLLQDYLPASILLPSSFGLLAVLHYAFGVLMTLPENEQTVWLKSGMVGTGLGAFLVFPYAETTLPMIFCLAGLGILAYLEAAKARSQTGKELAGSIVMASFQWWLYLLGVREVQVYTHLWALLLAGYAVWRNGLADREGEKTYTIVALCTLSIPLLLAALNASGETYGWLLIIEHVLLMIIGIVVNRRYVMWWGLGIATLAVLYQLRDLPFAGLGFLALVVIGVALYILNRQNSTKE